MSNSTSQHPGGGSSGRFWLRVLGEGEDHLSWSIGLCTLWGTRVRFHLILPIWIAAELLRTVDSRAPGIGPTSCLLGAFVFVLLARELARAAFARAMGAQFDAVVLWPLGGISAATPRGKVRAGFQPGLAESGGVLFGMLAWPVLAAAVWMLGGGWNVLTVSMFDPWQADGTEAMGGLLLATWSVYYANGVILAANLLLPMFPLDAARIIRGWQERRLGDDSAATLVCKLGFVSSLIGLVGGGVTGQTRMMAIGVLGGLATWIELRRARFIQGLVLEPVAAPGVQISPEALLESQESDEDARLDEILSKISRHGINSLSVDESAFLHAMTQRRRSG